MKFNDSHRDILFDEKRFLISYGGAGCVHPHTEIYTEFGIMRICDINRPMRVLSWNEKSQQFQLSLSGGSFPKGRANLLRISTSSGVFLSSAHHRILLSHGKYAQAKDLRAGDSLLTAQQGRAETILEFCRKLSLLNDRHYSEKCVNYLGDYANECRQYDPQLHEKGDYALFSEPQLGGAPQFVHSCSPFDGGFSGKLHSHTRVDLCCDHIYKKHCDAVEQHSQLFEEGRTSTSFSECIFDSLQEFQLFQKMFGSHRTTEQSSEIYQERVAELETDCFSCEEKDKNKQCLLSGSSVVLSIEECEFSEYWCMMVVDTNNYVSIDGAIHHNSGKSFSVAQKLFIRLVSEENHRILVARKVARTLRVSVFQLFKDIIAIEEMSDDFHVNKTDMTITYKENGNQLLFFGLDDIEKLKSIQGITSIWIEEASECEENDIAELNRRLRGHTDSYKQIIITFNPISHLHWLKARFFDNENANASIYKSTYKDNAFIDDEYKAEIESLKHFDIQQYNIYALGEWGVLNQNKVYHCYDYNKHSTALSVNDFDVLHCGVDFNVGGCAVVVCGVKGSSVYVVTGSALYDTDAVVTYLMKFNRQRVIVYPDASGGNASANAPLSSIEIIRRAGFYVDAPQINPAIRDRVNAVNRLFAQDKLFIGFEKLSHALQTQAYDESGKPEKSKSHAGGAVDDWNDALGYFISRKFPVSNKINNLQIKGI